LSFRGRNVPPGKPTATVPENNSGLGGPAPAQVENAGLHVGAMLSGWAWALAQGITSVALADLVLCVGSLSTLQRLLAGRTPATGVTVLACAFFWASWLGLRVLMGLRGYVWAWQHRRFRDLIHIPCQPAGLGILWRDYPTCYYLHSPVPLVVARRTVVDTEGARCPRGDTRGPAQGQRRVEQG